MPRRLLLAALVAAIALPAGAYPPVPKAKDKKPDAKEIAKAIQGTWEVTKIERAGAAMPKINYTMTVKIDGTSMTQIAHLQGRELKLADATFSLDARKSPPTFEVKQPATAAGRPEYVRMKGVLKVEGDVMTWVYVTAKGEMPTKIEGELGELQFRYTLKRVKK